MINNHATRVQLMNLISMLLDAKILTLKRDRVILSSQWVLYAQINRRAWDIFQDHYDWCDGGVREQVYCLLHNLNEPPGCVGCSSFVTFNIHKHKYNLYCSPACVLTRKGVEKSPEHPLP
jgi:hypothetical protein